MHVGVHLVASAADSVAMTTVFRNAEWSGKLQYGREVNARWQCREVAEVIDQVTRRRIMRTGLTALDEHRASNGYVLFCPSFWEGKVHLIDHKGRLHHEWSLPYWPRHWGYLLPNGNPFYLGRVSDEPMEFPAWRNEIGGILLEIDWSGRIVWEHRDRFQHHDGRRTESGGAIYLTVERVPAEIMRRVRGGIPGTDDNGMWADLLVEVDAQGRRVWEWDAFEHLDPERHVLPPNVARHEWSHANTIVPLPDSRVLVSFRHISTVAIIDRHSGRIVWSVGHETVSGQHDASMLPNGNVLVFDNGLFRRDVHNTFSRVVEINDSGEIVWEYRDSPPNGLYSPFIAGARRLANGNTLVTEGWFGRLFQVTPEGEVVWEYVNPLFTQNERGQYHNSVFRASHYSREQIERWSS